jgi:hypothetical protein
MKVIRPQTDTELTEGFGEEHGISPLTTVTAALKGVMAEMAEVLAPGATVYLGVDREQGIVAAVEGDDRLESMNIDARGLIGDGGLNYPPSFPSVATFLAYREGREAAGKDSEALDEIAEFANEPGDCNGGDLVDLVCRLLPETGRQVLDDEELATLESEEDGDREPDGPAIVSGRLRLCGDDDYEWFELTESPERLLGLRVRAADGTVFTPSEVRSRGGEPIVSDGTSWAYARSIVEVSA